MAWQHFYDQEGEFVTIEALMDWLRDHPLPEGRIVPLLIWGGMGIGKTQQIKAYARSRELEIITYHPAHDINGGDIVGESHIGEDGKTTYALPSWLPTENDKPGVLFIDEINRAPQEVLAGLMEPLGEGTIAQSGWKLPAKWNIVAAANPSELGYMVNDVDEAMVDRLLHYAPGWDSPAWGAWANSVDLHEDVINFAFQHQDSISAGEAQLPHELQNKLRATPRSLEYLAALYEPDMPPGLLQVVTEGLLGREPASQFREDISEQEKPLRPQFILQDPESGEQGSEYYKYDTIVKRWNTEPKGNNLLEATTQKLVSWAVLNEPSSLNVRENIEAQRIGRWLAILPPSLREDSLEHFARSASEWLPVLRDSVEVWTKALAKHNQILSTQVSRRSP